MKITGYRCVRTFRDWGRPIGDVNGYLKNGVTDVPVIIIETDEGIEGIGTGSDVHIEQLFLALEGEADYIFLDLEDAVAPGDKEPARTNVIASLLQDD